MTLYPSKCFRRLAKGSAGPNVQWSRFPAISQVLCLPLPVVALVHTLTEEACAGLLTAMLRPGLPWQQDAGGLVAGGQLRHHAADLLLNMAHLHATLHSMRRPVRQGLQGCED